MTGLSIDTITAAIDDSFYYGERRFQSTEKSIFWKIWFKFQTKGYKARRYRILYRDGKQRHMRKLRKLVYAENPFLSMVPKSTNCWNFKYNPVPSKIRSAD